MKKLLAVLLGVSILSGTLLSYHADAAAIVTVVTAKNSFENSGDIVKGTTGKSVNVTNYSGYGTLGETQIRFRAKIGGDFVTVLSARNITKNNSSHSYTLSNTVDIGKLIRFCYKLPANASVNSDQCKFSYDVH